METIKNALGVNKDSTFTGEGSHLAGAGSGSAAGTGHDSLGDKHTTEGVAANVPGAFPDVSNTGTEERTGYGDNVTRSGLGDSDTSRTLGGGDTFSRGVGDSYTTSGNTDTYGTSGTTERETYASRGTTDRDTYGTRGTAETDTSDRGLPEVTPSMIRHDSTPAVGTTYTARKFPLASGSGGSGDLPGSTFESSSGPHSTETANRLDPNFDRDSEYKDDRQTGSGLGTGAAIGTGVAATGAGAYAANEYSSRGDTERDTGYGSRRDDDDINRGSAYRSDQDKDDSYGNKSSYAGGALAGGAAAGAGAYAAHEYTSKNDDLGPASNTAGPHKSDTLNKADPRVEDDPSKARDLVMGLKKHPDTGEDQVVITGAGVDRDHQVVDPDERGRADQDDEDDDKEGKKKGTGSKILGVFGIGKDKDKDKESKETSSSRRHGHDSSDKRDAGTSDYTSSRDKEPSSGYTAAAAATAGTSAYDAREDAGASAVARDTAYDKTEQPSSYSRRQDDTEDMSTRRTEDTSARRTDDDDTRDSGEKKRGGLSGLLHRDNPNKLHKDPPAKVLAERAERASGDNYNTSSGGKHFGLDGEIGRDREVSGYGGTDARQTTTVDEIERQEREHEREQS